jgi:sterol desaturase/sphingolipid hydroxylase (fatty acid hydroxylase superfamily)
MMNDTTADISLALTSFVGSILFSTFIEYWGHRVMHWPALGNLHEHHMAHHTRNYGKGFLLEFIKYMVLGAIFVIPLSIYARSVISVSFAFGAILTSAFSAYCHQWQHDHPETDRMWWMSNRMPVHYVHHKHNMLRHNFGMCVDWWDHVFGTYIPHKGPWNHPVAAAAVTKSSPSGKEACWYEIKWV